MDPQFRSRLIAAIILLIVVCSAFSVSPVAGFRLENRDGNGTEAALAEALVLQQSTKIRNEYMENLTVYIDSRNEVFGEQGGPGTALGLYVPEENAIYIRSDQHPERADDVFAEQVGYRVYHTMGFEESTVFDPCRKARVHWQESAPRPVRRGKPRSLPAPSCSTTPP